jgi:hypothetical protein
MDEKTDVKHVEEKAPQHVEEKSPLTKHFGYVADKEEDKTEKPAEKPAEKSPFKQAAEKAVAKVAAKVAPKSPEKPKQCIAIQAVKGSRCPACGFTFGVSVEPHPVSW